MQPMQGNGNVLPIGQKCKTCTKKNYKSFLIYLNGINTGYDNVLVTGKHFNSDLLNNASIPMF